MKYVFVTIFALLVSTSGAITQNNVLTPNSTDLIQLTSPLRNNGSLTYTNPALLLSSVSGSALSLNATSGGCTESPGVRAPLYICNDNNGTTAAGYNVGEQIWIGNNPTGTPGANNPVGLTVYIDNLNNRSAIWATNFVCGQQPITVSGAATGIVHCNEVNVYQSIAATTPTKAFTAGSVVHAWEAVSNQNSGANPEPPQTAFWVWSAGDTMADSTKPWWNFAFAASRTNYAGFDCEVIAGDTTSAFTEGCLWDQSNSASTVLVTGTHNYVIDASGATLSTGFANCPTTCLFTGNLNVSGTNGLLAFNGITALSRNSATGALTISTNAANILMTPTGGTVAITGTLTASAIAANTGAQTGYLCYNTSGGVITYDGTNTCLVSSARYKTNIRALEPSVALAEVMKLKPSSFNRTLGDDRDERLGLIAEEVADVDPRMIVRDAEGLPRGVLYETGGIALLTGALQALKTEFDAYKRGHP